jgi:hydrogenase maturation protease
MNRKAIDRVANAVLYEGYILYPYRPSVKNQQRWTVGGLYPESYCRTAQGSEISRHQTQCLLRGKSTTAVEVIVRFLHLTLRQVDQFDPPLCQWPADGERPYRPVELLQIEDRLYHTWQEAEERELTLEDIELDAAQTPALQREFVIEGRQWQEPLLAKDGTIAGVLTRTQHQIEGLIEVSATQVSEGLFRLTVRVQNLTQVERSSDRNEALLRSFVSAHIMIGVRGGEFVSLLDIPDDCRAAAADCQNIGLWPVLIGEEGCREAMLASPIILYDYPQVAPESPGDLFDSTEIDEILTLRILTLTDEEKRQAVEVDERARKLLARTEALAPGELSALHGMMRLLRTT